MEQELELELRLESTDSSDTNDLVRALSAEDGVEVGEPRAARLVDPVTIIGLAGAVAGLFTSILQLHAHLRERRNPPAVRVIDENGRQLLLAAATPDQIREFLDRASEEDPGPG